MQVLLEYLQGDHSEGKEVRGPSLFPLNLLSTQMIMDISVQRTYPAPADKSSGACVVCVCPSLSLSLSLSLSVCLSENVFLCVYGKCVCLEVRATHVDAYVSSP